MAKAQQPGKPSFLQVLKQLPAIVKLTAQRDKRFLPLALAAMLIPLIAAGVAIALGAPWLWIPAAVMTALLGFMIVLNLRANEVRMREYESTPGGAAQVLTEMRGDWRVRPMFASTTQFDMVHVVVGRPGVILVAEGDANRVRSMLAQEKRRLTKIIGSTELREYVIGDQEGQLALRKVRSTLMRLPRTITGKDVNALDTRLTALAARPQLPKGAIPKNMRPKGSSRAMRGR
jgi:hypothetical protein